MHYKISMSNIKKPNVCLIGPGRIGMTLELDKLRKKPATHFGMWNSNKRSKFLAVCDTDRKKEKIARKLNKKILFYTDYKKMIKDLKPDIVSISTWKDSHYKITSDCLELGIKNIVLEKPLANNIHQAKKIIKKIQKNKATVIINHRRRFDKEVIKLQQKIKDGVIGEITQVSSNYVYGLLTTGTHLIDTLRMLLEPIAGKITYVFGVKNIFKNFLPLEDVNIDGFIFFKNGLKVSIHSHNIKDYDIFDFHLYGTKGKILITEIGRSILKYKIIKSPEHSGFAELESKGKKICKSKPRNQFLTLANNAIDCYLSSKSKPLCSAYDSYIDMKIINALLLSSKRSKVVKI
jgi:scyllo-inositol 2-dehydrogenase (NAD+)